MSEMTGKCQKIDSHSLMLGYLDGDNLDNDEREMLLFALYCESVSQPESIAQKAIKQLNEQGRTNGKPPAAPAAAEPPACTNCGSNEYKGAIMMRDGKAYHQSCYFQNPPKSALAEPVPQSEPLDVIELCERVRATIINTVREHFQHGLNIDRREWLEEKLTERVDETLDGIHSLAAPSPAETSQASDVTRVANLFELDPHQFSIRPCSTCKAITEILKRNFGCDRKRAALVGPGDAKETKR